MAQCSRDDTYRNAIVLGHHRGAELESSVSSNSESLNFCTQFLLCLYLPRFWSVLTMPTSYFSEHKSWVDCTFYLNITTEQKLGGMWSSIIVRTDVHVTMPSGGTAGKIEPWSVLSICLIILTQKFPDAKTPGNPRLMAEIPCNLR